ncbi:hypothetical protein DSM112329_00873 [Paraconexibacter sp. AEG42_29]|uniref:Uncharacterized protein n=1 Tax=Paraconexibacter sp. AEG42_29 TaxID=2997339 RepID=A0AAU7AQX7_9ACTN
MDDEPKRGRLSTGVSDLLNNLSSAALLIFAAVLFLAGAIGGIGLVSRLGGAGWFMYALVIGTYSLVFGPIIAQAMTMRQNGSPKHRAELERRREQQRRKFGLHLRATEATQAREEADSAEGRSAQNTSSSPASATNGPADSDTSVRNPGSRSSGGDRIR